uniref:B-cell differentiation antigen CD72-like n=1 Tax=Geotrypetes seraphini TaxID=260995 RepID=A0A6P8PMG5_GEOSA|nr:B-cell differentiation antigen CD72-like [Geotrypetes seraphini]
MARAVIYADLKFLKKSLSRKKPPRSNREGSTAASSEVGEEGDGDVTYENIQIPQIPEETVSPEPAQRDTNEQKTDLKTKWISHVTIILLIPSLILLSSTITLSVKYLQVSQHLMNSTKRLWLSSQEHEALVNNFSLTLNTQEETLVNISEKLKETELQLQQARSAQKTVQEELNDKTKSLETMGQRLKNYESEREKWQKTESDLRAAVVRWNQTKTCVLNACSKMISWFGACKCVP